MGAGDVHHQEVMELMLMLMFMLILLGGWKIKNGAREKNI